MANQSNQHLRSHYPSSLLSLSCFITFIIVLQGPIFVVAELSQYDQMMASQYKFRPNSTTSTVVNNDDPAYEAGADIYDDNNDDIEEMSLSPSSSTSFPRAKLPSNATSRFLRIPSEEVAKNEYEDESDSYQNDIVDDESSPPPQDNLPIFVDTVSVTPSYIKPEIIDSNMNKDLHMTTTFRIPFLPSNLWHDLFSKPGILVGIIGGVVIGMLSAILLVMFIIYRMRKKDEGSYALEEGPRKSPSHAYTRVSSREFFA